MASAQAKIEYWICLGVRGPISPGDYQVDAAKINVSYPDQIEVGLPTPLRLPQSTSTLFRVTWDDSGHIQKLLNGTSFERHVVVHMALAYISELLTAFKLVRVGHADGLRVRTVGLADTLMYTSFINGVPTGNLNIGMRLNKVDYPWFSGEANAPFDPHGTTKLALPHIGTGTYPVARKFVRCFELVEIGFYKEAIIVAHAILDDLVQDIIDRLLKEKGLDAQASRDLLIRAVKEQRLRIYLGPLLKVLAGISIDEIWSHALKALHWLNKTRNDIAHAGSKGERDHACWAIFVSMKAVAALNSKGLVGASFPPGMRRESRILASWTLNRPDWVPATPEEIEHDEFD